MNNLEQLRKRARLSRYALAKESELSYTTLQYLEGKGKKGKYPQQETLNKIARALAPHLKQTPGEVLAELTGVNEKTPA